MTFILPRNLLLTKICLFIFGKSLYLKSTSCLAKENLWLRSYRPSFVGVIFVVVYENPSVSARVGFYFRAAGDNCFLSARQQSFLILSDQFFQSFVVGRTSPNEGVVNSLTEGSAGILEEDFSVLGNEPAQKRGTLRVSGECFGSGWILGKIPGPGGIGNLALSEVVNYSSGEPTWSIVGEILKVGDEMFEEQILCIRCREVSEFIRIDC